MSFDEAEVAKTIPQELKSLRENSVFRGHRGKKPAAKAVWIMWLAFGSLKAAAPSDFY
jgi:hypothetical protein